LGEASGVRAAEFEFINNYIIRILELIKKVNSNLSLVFQNILGVVSMIVKRRLDKDNVYSSLRT
jgi:hypothetical protein